MVAVCYLQNIFPCYMIESAPGQMAVILKHFVHKNEETMETCNMHICKQPRLFLLYYPRQNLTNVPFIHRMYWKSLLMVLNVPHTYAHLANTTCYGQNKMLTDVTHECYLILVQI